MKWYGVCPSLSDRSGPCEPAEHSGPSNCYRATLGAPCLFEFMPHPASLFLHTPSLKQAERVEPRISNQS